MIIKFVSVEDGITALGFRKVAAVAKKINPNTQIYFVATGNLYSLKTHIIPSDWNKSFNINEYKYIAKELFCADLICFSSMTPSSRYVEGIIKQIRKKNKKVFILWGGTHAIINPEKAIKHVDAICIGEGEIPMSIFYKSYLNNKNYLKTPGMWFKKGKKIYRNKNLPLNQPKQMDTFPFLYNEGDCKIYDIKQHSFRQYTKFDYLNYNGLSYRTIWTIGCPFSCAYCANDAFIRVDPKYRIIRHPSVQYILNEIKTALKIYPFITSVVFFDDNFITNPVSVIKEFAQKYKKQIDLPFAVPGMHPNFITREKVNILAKAGMNRTRMGIQSGSERTLMFFNRPTPIKTVIKSANLLISLVKKYRMIPPAFDIIIDNPLETKEDLIDTFKLLYNLERPYTLNVFSLRVFPKTKLWDFFQNHQNYDIRQLTSSYLETRKTMASVLIYLLPVIKPPTMVFNYLLKKVENYSPTNTTYPMLYWITKTLFLVSRGIDHIKKQDFSTITGGWLYYYWKLRNRT